jgi:Histidine kinase-, DNA gyrase B-, and HSP90-like ATPase
VGIPPDDMSRLFDRFYRAPATADQAQGVGLGLYITHHLVHAHGGSLRVESEVNRGSAFTVSLPLFGDYAAAAPDRSPERATGDVHSTAGSPMMGAGKGDIGDYHCGRE